MIVGAKLDLLSLERQVRSANSTFQFDSFIATLIHFCWFMRDEHSVELLLQISGSSFFPSPHTLSARHPRNSLQNLQHSSVRSQSNLWEISTQEEKKRLVFLGFLLIEIPQMTNWIIVLQIITCCLFSILNLMIYVFRTLANIILLFIKQTKT